MTTGRTIFVYCGEKPEPDEVTAWSKEHRFRVENPSASPIIFTVEKGRLEEAMRIFKVSSLPSFHTIFFPPAKQSQLLRVFAGPAAKREEADLQRLPRLSATPAELLDRKKAGG